MKLTEHRFPYEWTLKDANFTKDKGTVFSCFACGGGSTMGYKLAGFDVLGCNEIDPKMMEAYKANHNPKYAYLEPIQTFKNRKDLPKELYDLDILDGSPPCSSFSMAGNREKDWGKEKKFREGQAEQILDNLFFDFIDLAKELQPKVVVAENVRGLMMGAAKEYVKKIYVAFQKAGYQLRIEPYLLDASKMGVPQRRKRVFFIALRNDLADNFMEQVDMFQVAPKLELNFKEREIPIKEFAKGQPKKETQNYSEDRFGDVMLDVNKASNTIATDINRYWLDENTLIDKNTVSLIGSYPLDYNHLYFNNPQYLIGMSVPPVMVANIATEIYNQWLSKTNKQT
jgi:DNA (cytosine-5)-methyltransferase 1